MIYVATSWRNKYQREAVMRLRQWGFHVYDFKHPTDLDYGFHWADIDPGGDWEKWSTQQFITALDHPRAIEGFNSDANACLRANACVLVLPSGRSAHLEAGFVRGRGKRLFIWSPERCEPELMYKFGLLSENLEDAREFLADCLIKPVEPEMPTEVDV